MSITLTISEELTTVLEILAGLPTPEEVLALRPSEALDKQIRHLLEKTAPRA